MRKTAVNILERTEIRAFYLWLAGAPGDAADHWLEAEAIETALAERRAVAASKAAATRRSKTKAPAEMLVAAKSQQKGSLTAH